MTKKQTAPAAARAAMTPPAEAPAAAAAQESPSVPLNMLGHPLSAEGARQAGVMANPLQDPARAIFELQALVMLCPTCKGAITQAMVDAGILG